MIDSPLLVIHEIVFDHAKAEVVAEISLGTQAAIVRISFNDGHFPSYREVPFELESYDAARRAVLEVLTSAFHGRRTELPLDLSSMVREVFSRWPAPVLPLEVVASADSCFELESVKCSENGYVTVRYRFNGDPSEVIVDARNASWPILFRFVRGWHPWQLNRSQQRVLLERLAAAFSPRLEAQNSHVL